MAVYLSSTGYLSEALAAAEEAMRVLGPGLDRDSVAYAQLLESRANALLGVNRPAEALDDAMRARAIYAAKLGQNHEQVHIMHAYQARAAMLLGRLAEATQLLESTIERYRKTGYSTVAAPTYLLGLTRRLAGDPAGALALQQAAFGAVRKGPTARRWGSRVLVEIGLNRLALGDAAGARAPLTEALAIVQERFREPTPLLAHARLGLAQVELAEGRPEAALPLLEAADSHWRAADASARSAGETAFWLGRALAALDRGADARAAMARAATVLATSPFAIDRPLLDEARKLSEGPATTARR
jgi:tetratricopeptide (TPR) repeat protein